MPSLLLGTVEVYPNWRVFGSLNLAMLAANKQRSPQQLSTNDSFAHCIEDELGGVVQVQFLQNVSAMSLDGVGANVESCCYFFVRLPFGQELQDLSLAAGKQVIAIDRALLLQNAA